MAAYIVLRNMMKDTRGRGPDDDPLFIFFLLMVAFAIFILILLIGPK